MNTTMRIGGFNRMPPVVKNLLIINGIFFLATFLLKGKIDLVSIFGMRMIGAEAFRPWQVITYMFMHGSFGHLFFNMFALWMFGSAIEDSFGSKKFLIYYFVTGIGAAAVHYFVIYLQIYPELSQINQLLQNPSLEAYEYVKLFAFKQGLLAHYKIIGASGSVFGILLAYGMTYPNNYIYVYFLLPIKAKWFVIIYGAIELIYGVSGTSDGIGHFAHLGGMIFGFFMLLYWKKGNVKTFFSFSSPFKKWKKFKRPPQKYATSYENFSQRPLSDEEYNARKVQEQKKIDEILDKISKYGYGSLTKAEKDFLFNYGKK